MTQVTICYQFKINCYPEEFTDMEVNGEFGSFVDFTTRDLPLPVDFPAICKILAKENADRITGEGILAVKPEDVIVWVEKVFIQWSALTEAPVDWEGEANRALRQKVRP